MPLIDVLVSHNVNCVLLGREKAVSLKHMETVYLQSVYSLFYVLQAIRISAPARGFQKGKASAQPFPLHTTLKWKHTQKVIISILAATGKTFH